MELEVKESVSLEDGKHEGVIERVENVGPPERQYKYTDVYIKEATSGYELKYGCPTNPGTNTKLMKLILQFQDLKVGDKFSPEAILTGKDVTFMTIQEKKGENTYTRIVDGSIKPKVVKEEQVE